jgi:16S rRNA (uracil1498-N3)-methyltransferase
MGRARGHVGKRDLALECVELLRAREDVPDFTLCAALLKKDRFDLVLEKACELGVARIQPVLTRRCVADKLNMERARADRGGGAMRAHRPAPLAEPVKLDALLKGWQAARALFFADEPAARLPPPPLPQPGRRRAAHRPRGRLRRGERAAIRALPQARPITLGPRILRGETACIAATALWMGTVGDWA